MKSISLGMRAVSILALVAAIARPVHATDPAVSLDPGRKQAIDDFIGQFVDLAMFDGTVLIDVEGTIVYHESFGFAHSELDVPHAKDTRFRIASVSKTLTDAAFARMIQAGKINLETPLARFLPTYPSAEKIMIRHLLEHSSGIPHTNAQPWGDGSISLPIDEIVDRLSKLPLDFEPGSDTSYSNGGYTVAAKVLEVVGDGSFAEVMRATVFDPLGMKDTDHIHDARSAFPAMATGYEPGARPGERRHPRFYAVETRPGGGSFYSTAPDLLSFARGVFRDGFITDDQKRLVLGSDEDGLLTQGRSPGFVAKLYYGAKDDIILVSLANSYAVPADWAKTIVAIASGSANDSGWPTIDPSTAVIGADEPRLGHYRSSRGGQLMVIERDDRGVMTLAGPGGEPPTGLVPLTDGAFLMPLYFQRCEQAAETRVITCRILSGDRRYSTVLTPTDVGDAPPP